MTYFGVSTALSALALGVMAVLSWQQNFLLLFAGAPLLGFMVNGLAAALWQLKKRRQLRGLAIASAVVHLAIAALALAMILAPIGELRF